jgi:hypothetical protein
MNGTPDEISVFVVMFRRNDKRKPGKTNPL